MENNRIGLFDKKGKMEIDIYKHAEWLVKNPDNEQCQKCFFLPACTRNSCPAQRVVHKTDNFSCPHEKENIDLTLQLLDKNNQFEFIF